MSLQEKIEILDQIGMEFGCKLHLPPFHKTNHPFFDITSICQGDSYSDFLITVKDTHLNFRFVNAKRGKKKYLEIILDNRNCL